VRILTSSEGILIIDIVGFMGYFVAIAGVVKIVICNMHHYIVHSDCCYGDKSFI